MRSLNHAYDIGELSITQKEGILTCIPKDNKPKHLLKNWRPLTLLNTSYKILSGVLSNRLKPNLDKLISKDQTGFISGRYIGDNTRLIYDLLNITETNNIPGLLLLIDFEKAFDSVSWGFLYKVLEYFNFGGSFISWIKILNNNIFSKVNQGGHLSEKISLQRGCRQGDPISSYLFILCAEILAIKIRNDKDIKGISIDRFEYKISQYADDTTIMLDGSEKSLNKSLFTLSWYEKISGLKINFDKTQVIWIGSKKYCKDIMCHRWKLNWGQSQFKLLGINFDVDLSKICDINYKEKIRKIESIIKTWRQRKITPIGKIALIKSLLISQLNHLILSIPNPPNSTLKTLERMFFQFIWDGKKDKIKRETITKVYEEGGLNMVNITAYVTALKSTWIRKILNSEGIWQNILFQKIQKKFLLKCGVSYIEDCILKVENHFWRDVLYSWKKIIDVDYCSSSVEQNIACMPLWYNNNFMINNKSFIYKELYDNGFMYVNDLLNIDGSFLTYDELTSNFSLTINFLDFQSIRASVFSFIQKHRDLQLKKL